MTFLSVQSCRKNRQRRQRQLIREPGGSGSEFGSGGAVAENSAAGRQSHRIHQPVGPCQPAEKFGTQGSASEFGSPGDSPWCQPDAPRAAGELLWFPHVAMITGSFPHPIIPVKSIIFLCAFLQNLGSFRAGSYFL